MKFIVFGLGREGRSSYRFLRNLFPKTSIVLTDDKPLTKLNPLWKTILVQDNQTSFTTSKNLRPSALKSSILVIAPGIPPTHPLIKKANRVTPIVTNTELFLETCLPDRAKHSILASHLPKLKTQPLVIGVTGTKGKSTTASAIHHLLKTAKLPALLGGNIGKPPLDLLPDLANMSEDSQVIVVLELSSHQLSRVNISPQIAVVQAITPEHLDYYDNFAEYLAAKAQLASFQQPTDWIIFNADSKTARQVATCSSGEKICFGIENTDHCPITLIKKQIVYQEKPFINLSRLRVRGQHNALNLMPSLAIGKLLHLSDEIIDKALTSFTPLPHRLEYVTTKSGVEFYNDSLSTTPEATMAALKSFGNHPIVLIAGGYDRGLDYQPLAKSIIQNKVKAVLLLPTTGGRIASILDGESKSQHTRATNQLKILQVPDLKTAVTELKSLVKSGDIVLLSPASASFNQFKDYAQRGEMFRQLVEK